MNSIMQWCNDNAGVVAILIAVVTVMLPKCVKYLSECVKHIREKVKRRRDNARNAELEVIIKYLKVNIVASTKKLAKVLNKSEEHIRDLLIELICNDIVEAAVDNCDFLNPNSVWQLKRR